MNFAPSAFERRTGGALSTTQFGNYASVFVTAAANGTETALHFYALTGRYDFNFRFGRSATAGIVEIYVDGVLKATVDTYTAGPSDTITQAITDLRLTEGQHEVVCRVNGKNPAATNYACFNCFSTIIQH